MRRIAEKDCIILYAHTVGDYMVVWPVYLTPLGQVTMGTTVTIPCYSEPDYSKELAGIETEMASVAAGLHAIADAMEGK